MHQNDVPYTGGREWQSKADAAPRWNVVDHCKGFVGNLLGAVHDLRLKPCPLNPPQTTGVTAISSCLA
jgi:hypothetical protein